MLVKPQNLVFANIHFSNSTGNKLRFPSVEQTHSISSQAQGPNCQYTAGHRGIPFQTVTQITLLVHELPIWVCLERKCVYPKIVVLISENHDKPIGFVVVYLVFKQSIIMT